MKIDGNGVVIITGGSRGIGRACAIEFAQKGAKVVLGARDTLRMDQVSKEIKKLGGEAISVPCDVSHESDCQKLISETVRYFGKIDVLVNNAGFGHYASIENLENQALDQIFRTNLWGAIWCAKAALPYMKKQKSGHIVNVSTIISKRSMPYMTAYCMTKFAMNAFDEGLRLEVRPYGIGVSLVCPGLTNTEFQMNAGKSGVARPLLSKGGMSAEKVGRVILRAVERNKRRVALTLSGKFLLAVQRISPAFVDEILYFYFSKFRTT